MEHEEILVQRFANPLMPIHARFNSRLPTALRSEHDRTIASLILRAVHRHIRARKELRRSGAMFRKQRDAQTNRDTQRALADLERVIADRVQ